MPYLVLMNDGQSFTLENLDEGSIEEQIVAAGMFAADIQSVNEVDAQQLAALLAGDVADDADEDDADEDDAEEGDAEEDDAEENDAEEGPKISLRATFEALRANPPKIACTNPLKNIKAHCLESCCCGNLREVLCCPADGIHSKPMCALWPFRMGKNPYRAKREVSEEQREKSRQRFMKMRAAKQ